MRPGFLRFTTLLVAAAIIATLPSYTALGQQPGALPAGAADKPLTNQDVIRMVKAGLGDDLIIGKIRTSPCQFDTSVEAMLQLKGDGVSENVIRRDSSGN
jgi:hypothetical protein